MNIERNWDIAQMTMTAIACGCLAAAAAGDWRQGVLTTSLIALALFGHMKRDEPVRH
jgi:hypothetical protein